MVEKKQVKHYWKTLAIIFIILFVLETLYVGLGVYLVMKDERMIKECAFNICSEYPEYYLEGNVCYCYGYDMLGEIILEKTEVMK